MYCQLAHRINPSRPTIHAPPTIEKQGSRTSPQCKTYQTSWQATNCQDPTIQAMTTTELVCTLLPTTNMEELKKISSSKCVLSNKNSTSERHCQPTIQVVPRYDTPRAHQQASPTIHSNGQGSHDHAAARIPINKKSAAGHPWCVTGRRWYESTAATVHGRQGLDILFWGPRRNDQRKDLHRSVWKIPGAVLPRYVIFYCCCIHLQI